MIGNVQNHGINRSVNSSGGASLASFVTGLAPAAWFRFNTGITVATGVSQWNDQTPNARHLKQAVAGNQPALQADGSILFDGVAHFLKCDPFTLNQPETVYLLAQQATWTSTDTIYDGDGNASMLMDQVASSPNIRIFAGSALGNTAGWAVASYAVITAVFNSTTSVVSVNNGTPLSGDAGALNAGGFTLGARGVPSQFGNIQVKEAILFSAAHAADTRQRVIRYLGQVGGLNI